jgi:tetratricopeptide (TPR) repeat protein
MPENVEELLRRSDAARREGLPDEARRLAEAAADQARVDDDRAMFGVAAGALARLDRDEGRIDSAIALYRQAAELARAEGNTLRLAHHLRHLGDIHQDLGRLDRARSCYEESLILYRGRRDTPALDLANLLRPLAMLEERTGGETRSAELWAEAGTLYAEAKVEAGVAESARRLERLITR